MMCAGYMNGGKDACTVNVLIKRFSPVIARLIFLNERNLFVKVIVTDFLNNNS